MNKEDLDKILDDHKLWLFGEGGERANLRDANLRDANLRGAPGNQTHLMSIFLEKYPVVYTDTHMQIGCEKHLISEWLEFDDIRIVKMDGKDALKWWRKYKEFIVMALELSPAAATGYVEKEDADNE